MGFQFGTHSRRELAGVHEDLVDICEIAIATTPIDFTVHDGIRTEVEQRALVEAGASFTMRSMHLPGHDGKGRAVDLVPWIGGKLRWEWDPILLIAKTMREAALSVGVDLRWGAAWDSLLTSPEGTDPQQLSAMYVWRQATGGKRVFLDGPHYELLRTEYPDAT